jgi:ATP-dependent helicase/nuclease subunit A
VKKVRAPKKMPPRPHTDGFTDQQRSAIRRRGGPTLVSSGAGCGKTFVLTHRYLDHLRSDGVDASQIVAITFTERAAREMRERIRAAIVKEIRQAATDDAAEQWRRQRRLLDRAPITTIHSFCAMTLRGNAVAAGLDPEFEIIERTEAEGVLRDASIAALQRVLIAETIEGEDLRQLVRLYGWNAVTRAVTDLVREADRNAWSDAASTPPAAVAEDWTRFWCETFRPRYVRFFLRTNPKVTRCVRLMRDHPPSGCDKMSRRARTILETIGNLSVESDLASSLEALGDAAKVAGTKGEDAWPREVDYEEVKAIFANFRKALGDLDWLAQTPAKLDGAVAIGQRFLRVALAVEAEYRRQKEVLAALDFHDLLQRTRDLLRDRPDVRAELRERYAFVLIDELQDTDPVQMELAEAIVDDLAAAPGFFGVGDHKQSIYRFRGADSKLFRQLMARMPDGATQGLTENFRSEPAVLHFTNALFAGVIEPYEPLAAHYEPSHPDPCIEFLWSERQPRTNAPDARADEAACIARRVAEMIDGEPLVADRSQTLKGRRAARAGDIAILFRAMSHVAIYENALRQRGIDYYLVGGRAFFAQQEIYDVLHLLRALDNPHDSICLAGTLRSPFCSLSDEALFALAMHPDGLWAGVLDLGQASFVPSDERGNLERARRQLARWRTLKDRLPMTRLLGTVIEESGFDAALQFEPMGDRKLANLWKLVDLARGYDRGRFQGIADFVDRLQTLTEGPALEEEAATHPENADVVRLMSIHQAKGLEFPVVFIPDCAAERRRGHVPLAIWSRGLGCIVRPPDDEEANPVADSGKRMHERLEEMEEWDEEIRILYVACTRAQDHLVLSASLAEDYEPAGPWMQTLAQRFDLSTGRFLAGDRVENLAPAVRVTRHRHG